MQDNKTPAAKLLIMPFWSSGDIHLNIEVFKGYCVSPEQLHGILRYKRDAKKALHLVRPWPLCHLRHKTRDAMSPLVKRCHECLHVQSSFHWCVQGRNLLADVGTSLIAGLIKIHKDPLNPSTEWVVTSGAEKRLEENGMKPLADSSRRYAPSLQNHSFHQTYSIAIYNHTFDFTANSWFHRNEVRSSTRSAQQTNLLWDHAKNHSALMHAICVLCFEIRRLV